jgi:hypothetical protein
MSHSILQKISIFFLALVCISCVSVGKLTTQSGKPEIVIENKTTKQVIDAITAFAPTKGFHVDKTSDYNVTTVGSSPSGWNTSYNLPSTNTYSFVQQGQDVKLYLIQFQTYSASVQDVFLRPSGSVMQNTENNTQDGYEMLQQELVDLKKFIQGK